MRDSPFNRYDCHQAERTSFSREFPSERCEKAILIPYNDSATITEKKNLIEHYNHFRRDLYQYMIVKTFLHEKERPSIFFVMIRK